MAAQAQVFNCDFIPTLMASRGLGFSEDFLLHANGVALTYWELYVLGLSKINESIMARRKRRLLRDWINSFAFRAEPYYSVQWYLVRCGFPKVKACDGSLVSVNHYCRRGPNAIFIVLRRNLVQYYNEPGEMYDSG